MGIQYFSNYQNIRSGSGRNRVFLSDTEQSSSTWKVCSWFYPKTRIKLFFLVLLEVRIRTLFLMIWNILYYKYCLRYFYAEWAINFDQLFAIVFCLTRPWLCYPQVNDYLKVQSILPSYLNILLPLYRSLQATPSVLRFLN